MFEIYDEYAQQSIRYFLDSVLIASAPEPKRFGEIAEPWQREMLDPKCDAVDALTGKLPQYTGPRSFLNILARGHAKSSAEAWLISYCLCYSNNPIECYLVASDKDQAKIILNIMEKEAQLNPWYGCKLKFTRNEVVGPAGVCKVLAADAGSAYGLQGNLYICDEITHWKGQKGQDMWNAVWSGRAKVPGSLFVVISNAGILDSWQDVLIRRPAYDDPKNWRVFEREGNLASWMTAEAREEVRKRLPELEASRLLDNKWINAAEASGYLRPEDVEACEDARCPATPPIKNKRYQYIASVDYGRVKDRTVLVLLHIDEHGRTIIDDLTVLAPQPGRPVDVAQVDAWIDATWSRYQPRKIVADPYQLEATIQRLEKEHKPVERFKTRGGAGNMDLAMHLRSLITNRKIAWNPRYKSLTTELKGLVTKFTSYGFRFDHTSGQHDDQAVAVAMGALEATHYPAFPASAEVPDKRSPRLPSNPLQTGFSMSGQSAEDK